MKHHIKNPNGDIITSFVYDIDRDYALDAINEGFDIDPDSDEALVKYDD